MLEADQRARTRVARQRQQSAQPDRMAMFVGRGVDDAIAIDGVGNGNAVDTRKPEQDCRLNRKVGLEGIDLDLDRAVAMQRGRRTAGKRQDHDRGHKEPHCARRHGVEDCIHVWTGASVW